MKKKMTTNADFIATFVQKRLKITRTELRTSAPKQLFFSDWRKDFKSDGEAQTGHQSQVKVGNRQPVILDDLCGFVKAIKVSVQENFCGKYFPR